MSKLEKIEFAVRTAFVFSSAGSAVFGLLAENMLFLLYGIWAAVFMAVTQA